MATSTNNTNSFNLSGYVAVNANIRNFEKSSVARFPLSVSRTETNGDETIGGSLAQVRRGIDLRASQERQARPGFRIHPPGRMDIGGRNQAQPHRLCRHIRQRTVHREENRREKAGERQGFQKESGVTSHPSLIKRRLRPSFLLLTGCVHPFIVLRFRLYVIHIPLYAHDNRLYHIVFIRQSPVRFLRRIWR